MAKKTKKTRRKSTDAEGTATKKTRRKSSASEASKKSKPKAKKKRATSKSSRKKSQSDAERAETVVGGPDGESVDVSVGESVDVSVDTPAPTKEPTRTVKSPPPVEVEDDGADAEPAGDAEPATVGDAEPAKKPPRKATDPPEPRETTVGVLESTPTMSHRANTVLDALGFRRVDIDATGVAEAEPGELPDVLLLGLPGHQELVDTLSERAVRPVLVGAVNGPAASALAAADQSKVDVYCVRPHGKDGLGSAMHAAETLLGSRERSSELEADVADLHLQLQRYGEADAETGFQHFDFFRRLLVMELKRARRYGYSLAAVLVAIDRPRVNDAPPAEVASELRRRVAQAIGKCCRDIDLPVHYAEDRMLVFLPYTDIEGATKVGNRIATVVHRFGNIEDGDEFYTASVSVGIAALRPGKPISFAKLMKDATAAVRAAQLKGGGQVVVRK